ncbi:hypothetical protein EMGBD1_09570 [Anaerolineaceae bacterium]|nr:hypothetical protein EMGBD1_09570 [Anaerolineaceae bacterium]
MKFKQREWIAAAAILALAAGLRLWRIGALPQALQYDEALNGLVVMKLLRGELPPLVTYPGGREPLVFYLQAASVALLGRTPGALRLPLALASSALVLGAGLLARELWGRKVGWLSALLCATTFWPVYLGRLGTRPVLFPLLAAFGLWALARGWRSRRWQDWVLGGVLLGATHYTYSPNLFVLPALFLLGAGVLWQRPAMWAARWRELLLAGGLAAAVAAPVLLFRTVIAPEDSSRPRELAVFYAGQGAADLARTVVAQSYLTLRMFVYKGDLEARHNLPGRAVFDIWLLLPLLLGAATLATPRQRWRGLFVCMWLLMFLLPTFLAKAAPHFLRACGILPVLFVVPALGLQRMQQWLRLRAGALAAALLPALLLSLSIGLTVRDYWLRGFLETPAVLAAFDGEDAQLVLEINRHLGFGWLGTNLRALPDTQAAVLPLLVADSLWDASPYAQFLAALPPQAGGRLQRVATAQLPPQHALLIAPITDSAQLAASARARIVRTTPGYVLVEWLP